LLAWLLLDFEAPAIDPDYQLGTLVIHGEDDETVELKHVMTWAKEQTDAGNGCSKQQLLLMGNCHC
jgi:alpha/beta superfamily hydrolase